MATAVFGMSFMVGSGGFGLPQAKARTAQEIQGDINGLNSQLGTLDNKIAQLEKQISAKEGEVHSLQDQLAVIQAEIDKLNLEIEKSVKKIQRTEAEIEKTTIEIMAKEEDINKKKKHLAELVRMLYRFGQRNMFEVVLANQNFSDILNEVQYTTLIQGKTQENLDSIQSLKAELEAKKKELESQRQKAIDLRVTLEGQKLAQKNQQSQKDFLLKKTKGEEEAYQELLADNKALQKQVISDITELESELAAQGSSGGGHAVPPGNGILKWPVIGGTVTQEYGHTEFGGGVYPGGVHNGIDISKSGSACGTPIYAAHDGTITATGAMGGVAYGNWVAIAGDNDGLTTLYGHLLSSADVAAGQHVTTGDVIGHMGTTGFSTGCHVHFTVFTVFMTVQKSYGLLPYGNHVNPRLYL